MQSIIENYDGEELLNVARKKFEQILETEISDTTKFQESETYINIFDEEINYEILFEEENDSTEIQKIIENEK